MASASDAMRREVGGVVTHLRRLNELIVIMEYSANSKPVKVRDLRTIREGVSNAILDLSEVLEEINKLE